MDIPPEINTALIQFAGYRQLNGSRLRARYIY